MTDDERIDAYLSGDLAGQARVDFELAMDGEPALAERVDARRAFNDRVRAAAAAIDGAPLSPGLAGLLAEMGAASPAETPAPHSARPERAANASSPINLMRFRRAGSARHAPFTGFFAQGGAPRLAAAACVVLTVAAALSLLRPGSLLPGAAPALLVAGVDVSRPAATTPSGESAGGVLFSASYRNADGGFCRVFTLPAVSDARGLTCREGAEWRLIAYAERPPGSFAPAGADGDGDVVDIRTAAMARLTAAEEAALLGTFAD
ncbi:MAG: hypothetical protein AAGC56_09205 [Pseudomonadota bacterium]